MAHTTTGTNNLKIFNTLSFEAKEELEEKLEKSLNLIQNLLENISSEREANDILTKHVSIGNTEHESVCIGLLCKILSDRQTASKTFQNLMMVNRDSLNCVLLHMNIIIIEKFRKLTDAARMQVLWIVNELVRTSANGSENLCIALMKQIVGGGTSAKNVWMCENVLDMLINNQAWVEKSISLLQITVYTYLRLLQDHFHSNFTSLRQKEANFVVTLMREKWMECCCIGRDLIRLMSAVARIPEIERLWSDVLYKPETLSPSFTGVLSLLQTRTSRKFLTCRVTPDMENKLNFILLKVRFGNHKRYQDWFQRQYLATPDSQTLRSDLIRYICGCIYPSNEILSSDIIPRWAVIGWLLSTCTSRIATSYSNLALFWDWLFYSPDKNSIMDIEPGVLVMHQSIRSHPAITTSLLDFLCRTMVEFHPPINAQIKQGVHLALRTILEKRVVQSLSPILDNPKLDNELRGLIRANLSEFCSLPIADGKPPLTPTIPLEASETSLLPGKRSDDIIEEEPMVIDDDDSDNETLERKSGNNDVDVSHDSNAIFSDDEEDYGKKGTDLNIWRESPTPEPRDINSDMERLDDTLRDLIGQLQRADLTDLDERCERMQDIIDHVLSMDEFDNEVSTPLSSCLTQLLSDHFCKSIITLASCDITDEYLERCVEKPLYVIFRNLCQSKKDEDSFGVLLSLLSEMYSIQSRLGYHLLFFLAVKNQTLNEDNMFIYESFAQNTQLGDVYNCLMMDLKHCQEDNSTMLVFLVPHVYKEFPEHCIGNSELLNIIVAVLDPQQLEELQCLIMMGSLCMMKKDGILNVLVSSLEWESFEQYCVWQLFAVHDLQPDLALPLLQKLNSKNHPEALSMLLLAFRHQRPTQEMVKHVISRQFGDGDRFATSLLRHWAIGHMKELAEHLTVLLSKSKPRNTPPRKGLRQSVRSSHNLLPPSQPTIAHMLNHVDNLRKSGLPKSCNLFSQDSIIACLVHVQQHCDDTSKTRFSDLFALADDSEDEVLLRDIRNTRKRNKSTSVHRSNSQSRSRVTSHTGKKGSEESESDSLSDDDDFKKKRKRVKSTNRTHESSDSD
nr:integrator complex subunit 3-like isoform X2 [Ciona intestinalis]|eukprot:XP_009861046.1 integrator complex subunit 3-like isoform X2 [Ciona intestinalis]